MSLRKLAFFYIAFGLSFLNPVLASAPESHEKLYADDLKKVVASGGYETYKKTIANLLESKNFAAIEEYFSNIQKAYENGAIDDVELFFFDGVVSDIFDGSMSDPNSDYEDIVFKWTKQIPDSYSAHLFSAEYYIAKAWHYRGEAWAKDTTPAQLKAFNDQFIKARAENIEALKLSKKPMGALYNKLELLKSSPLNRNQVVNDGAAIVEEAIAIDPNNMMARSVYLTLLQPRWFGSNELMQAFLDKTKKENLPKEKMNYLTAKLYGDTADMLEQEKRYDEVLPYAKQAALLQTPYYNYPFAQNFLKLYIRALIYTDLEKQASGFHMPTLDIREMFRRKVPAGPDTLAALDTLLNDRYVDEAGFYYNWRGRIRMFIKDDPAGAWQDLTKAAALGGDQGDSLYNLGLVYCAGVLASGAAVPNVGQDPGKCSEYMRAAAHQGSAAAATRLQSMEAQ